MPAFGPDHYVPVLKVKPAEKAAMYNLSASVAARVTPLLEIVERKEKSETKSKAAYLPSLDEHLDETFRGLRKAVNTFDRYFLDCRELAPDGHAAAVNVFASAAKLGTPFIPVVSITRTSDVAAALAHRKHGIAIRLSYGEFSKGRMRTDLPKFIEAHGLLEREVDLFVDLEDVDQMIGVGVAERVSELLAEVPNHAAWRTFTLSACDFPSSLKIEADSHELFPRLHWNNWREELFANRSLLTRLPSFSDCGIQHRKGVEGIDFSKISPSATIRHALAGSWYIAKGRNMAEHGGAQFQGLAAKALSDTAASGAHCPGCRALPRAAADPKGYKSPQKWRELGTIHHITLTAEILAALPWP